jgi:hypothetical protein
MHRFGALLQRCLQQLLQCVRLAALLQQQQGSSRMLRLLSSAWLQL